MKRTNKLSIAAFAAGVVLFASVSLWLRAATSLAVPLNQTAVDPLMQGLTIPANAATTGMWSGTQPWPLNGIHVNVMPDGRVLTYGTPQNAPGAQDGRAHDYWTPGLGFGANSHATTFDAARPNSFCGTSSFLPDGRLIVTGGNSPNNSGLINPQTGVLTQDSATLADQRWYATMVTLADGRVVIVGGMDPYTEGQQDNPAAAIQAGQASMTPEIYTPGIGWRTLTGATSRDAFGPDLLRNSYPRSWLAPDGRVFGISSDNMWYLDVNANNGAGAIALPGKFKTPSRTAPVNTGASGTAVMFAPGRVLMVGGNGAFNGDGFPASNMATIVDINGAAPVITETNRMTFPRRYPNSVVLPNGRVVVTGGTRNGNNGGADAVYAAEIWDPATGGWTVGASAAQIRVYHSSTTLLPNGTILSVGGGAPGPVDNQNAEIYYPPYLFTAGGGLAARPVMTGINSLSFAQGASLQIQMSDAAPISSLALVRNGSMTHSFNNGQRFQRLTFTQNGDMLSAALPGSANQTPPGYYQIYALNANGVPSQAAMVSIGLNQAAPTFPALGSEWIPAGTTASRLAVAADNTIAVIDPVTATVRRKSGDDTNANWTTVAGKTLNSVALVNGSSIWGTGTDLNVWRYDGTNWIQLGNTARDIAASSDGTIVVVNAAANTIWRKRGNDNVENWTNVPGNLKRVALVNGNTIWGIGMDDGIYRHDGTNWTRIGTGLARSIAASANGTIVYADRDTGQVYRKTGDDTIANFTAVTGRVPEVAVAQSGAVWAVSGTNQVHRRAADAPLPVITSITAPPVQTGTAVSYNPGLDGPGLTFSWNFGDGTASTPFVSTSAITHTFPGPGQYLISLTVRNAAGETVSKTFIQAIHVAPAATVPTASGQMLLETRTGASARLWVVNPDSQSVSVIDTATNTRVRQITVGAAPRTLARAANGNIWVVNRDAASISVISPSTLAVTSTIALPPASQPYAIVTASSGRAYVSLEAAGRVVELDANGATLATLNVGANARNLSLSGDGRRLLVSRFITPPAAGEATLSIQTANAGGEVLAVNTPGLALAQTIKLQHSDKIDTEIQGAGLPNYLGAAVIAPDGASAWVPSKQDNIKRGTARSGQNLNFQNTVRAITSRINLTTLTENFAARIDHDNSGIGSAAVFHPTGAYLFVALETSREVAVVDPLSSTPLFRIPAGLAPQGLALSADGRRLYIHNFMDRSVTVADISPLTVNGEFRSTAVATVPTVATETLAANVLRGKQLFYDAADRRLARDAYLSCAVCHHDASHDGRVWDLTGFGEGLRKTIQLRGRAGLGHGFLHWSANFDEVQDFEGQIRNLAGGTGLLPDAQFNTGTRNQPLGDPKAGLSADLDALAAYVGSLDTFAASPERNANGTLTAAATAGKAVFAAQNCQSCHGGAAFTLSAGASQLKSIGTIKPASGSRLGGTLTGLDIPTLRDVWATAPYLHDGSAATLNDAIAAHSGTTLSATDMNNLVQYLRQIGGTEPAPPAPVSPPTVSLTSPANGASFTAGTAITLSATAGAATGRTLTSVAFLDGSTVVATVTTAPYSFNWTNAAAGNHTLTARATDNTGAATTSAAVNITVNAVVNRAPSISLTAPTAGAAFAAPATVAFTVNASDPDNNLARVEYFQGATKIGESTVAPYSFSWTNVAAGTYSLTARATDTGSLATTSAAVSITVSAAASTGLTGDYYDSLDYTNLRFSRTDATVDFTWGNASPGTGITATAFSVKWSGKIIAPATTDVTFCGTSDDGMSVRINNALVVDNYYDRTAPGTSCGALPMTQGTQYDIAIDYYNNGTGSQAQLRWWYPGGNFEVVPTTALRPRAGAAPQAPSVTITSPANAASFTAPASIAIAATATDPDGTIARVEFFNGATKLGEDTTAPYSFTWANVAAGTYQITVRATDNTGLAAAASVNVTVTNPGGPGTGLKGDYFTNLDWTGLKFSRTDASINFNWGTAGPGGGLPGTPYSVRWTGQIEGPATEQVVFCGTSSSGMKVTVGTTVVVDGLYDHPTQTFCGVINMTQGQKMPITIDYTYNNTGGSTAKLEWWYPSGTFEVVPTVRLYPQ